MPRVDSLFIVTGGLALVAGYVIWIVRLHRIRSLPENERSSAAKHLEQRAIAIGYAIAALLALGILFVPLADRGSIFCNATFALISWVLVSASIKRLVTLATTRQLDIWWEQARLSEQERCDEARG